MPNKKARFVVCEEKISLFLLWQHCSIWPNLKPKATSKNACEIYLIDIGTIFVIKKEQPVVSP